LSRLLLVRHGITDHNSNRQFAGATDVELSDDGYRQVERLRERLAGEQIDAIYCSDLKRTLATAEVITSGHDVGIISCPELREMDYGVAEGLTFKEIGSRYPELWESIANFSPELSFPGGECFDDFVARAVKFMDRLKGYGEEETVLIVSHGGMLKLLVCDLLGIDYSHWPQIRFDNASLSIVETYSRRVILSLLNDTSHLQKAD
jgi:alpha-ribazole phosphatase